MYRIRAGRIIHTIKIVWFVNYLYSTIDCVLAFSIKLLNIIWLYLISILEVLGSDFIIKKELTGL
jgi:hypothetical protein